MLGLSKRGVLEIEYLYQNMILNWHFNNNNNNNNNNTNNSNSNNDNNNNNDNNKM